MRKSLASLTFSRNTNPTKVNGYPDGNYETLDKLEGNFKWILSNEESRLVTLVAFFQQLSAQKKKSAGGKS